MAQKNQKSPVPVTDQKIEYLGLWGFALVWLKVFVFTAIVVLILKYIFRVQIFI